VLRGLPSDRRIGVGLVNQKHERVESVEEILDRARRAIACFGAERVLLTPDCGFATFADNPVAMPRIRFTTGCRSSSILTTRRYGLIPAVSLR